MIILLDSGPLGLITNPNVSAESLACQQWLVEHLRQGSRILVPEIIEYELRRELLLHEKTQGLQRLEALASDLGILPVSRAVLLKAATFWADARKRGRPTAHAKALDIDMILCAQAAVAATFDDPVIIATTNTRHLSLFADARPWADVSV